MVIYSLHGDTLAFTLMCESLLKLWIAWGLSGFKDQRYNPIEEDEVPFLSCEVSLLKNFQPIDNMEVSGVSIKSAPFVPIALSSA